MTSPSRCAAATARRTPETITYRQQDAGATAWAQPACRAGHYDVAVGGRPGRREAHLVGADRPQAPQADLCTAAVAGDAAVLTALLPQAAGHRGRPRRASFRSDGFTQVLRQIHQGARSTITSPTVEDPPEELGFGRGVLISASLGPGNKRHRLRAAQAGGRAGGIGCRSAGEAPVSASPVADRDESRPAGTGRPADPGHQPSRQRGWLRPADHILQLLPPCSGLELAFYVGCLNLREALTAAGEPVCCPGAASQRRSSALSARGLYDPCAEPAGWPAGPSAMTWRPTARRLIMITGANQGGKSTFLRSVGLAQLMMQCGHVRRAPSRSRASVSHGHLHALQARRGRDDEAAASWTRS